MNPPAILAVDIGGGTQDILLFDPDEPLDNAVKLVLPSPTVIAARRIRAVKAAGKAVFLSGQVMGGGAVVRAIKDHLAAGLDVYSLEDPARTIHDDVERARNMGVRIVTDPPPETVEVVLGDVDPGALGGPCPCLMWKRQRPGLWLSRTMASRPISATA